MNLRNLLIGVCLGATALVSAAGLPWAKDYSAALSQAKKAKKIVMIDFTAVWCANCHKLDRTTYSDAQVGIFLAKTVPVKVDTDMQKAIAKKYGVSALPVILFTDASGKEIGRITGYLDAKQFIAKATPIVNKKNK